MVAGLALHAYVGRFSRLLADDFCTFGSLRSHGFFGSQLEWYLTWSGRFSFTWMINSLHLIGPAVTPWLSAIVLVAWMASAVLAFRALTRWQLTGAGGLALLSLAGLLVFATLALAPNLYQVLYWQTGLVTYSIPLLLLLVLGAWHLTWSSAREARAPRSAEVLSFALGLVIAGFSETVAVVQTALLGVLVIWTSALPHESKQVNPLLRASLLGSAVGLGIVAAAPGNTARQGLLPERTSPLLAASRAVRDAYLFSFMILKWKWQVLAIASLAPFAWRAALLQGGDDPRSASSGPRWWIVLGLPVLAFLLVAGVMFPSEFAVSSYPDGRILVTAAGIVIASIMIWANSISSFLVRRFRDGLALPSLGTLAALALLGLVFLQGSTAISGDLGLLTDAREYAARWDERDAQIRQAVAEGAEKMQVASLTHMAGLAEVERDPDEWINRCIAETYGLQSVSPK